MHLHERFRPTCLGLCQHCKLTLKLHGIEMRPQPRYCRNVFFGLLVSLIVDNHLLHGIRFRQRNVDVQTVVFNLHR